MKVVKEFSRHAHEYNRYNVIQKAVAQKLCTLLERKSYAKILDIGAGDGAVYENLLAQNVSVSNFIALDLSAEMLEIHPTDNNISKLCLDFNDKNFPSLFHANEFDLIISSSALQWSSNISLLLNEISPLGNEFLFSFFTANTFKTLHRVLGVKSPILKKEEILEALDEFFEYELEVIEYKMNFDSVHEMLRYIKHSGVSGGRKQLSYKQIKNLISIYPLDYLEFEVMFVKVIGKM